MPPKDDPFAEILAILKDEFANNKVDKATWGTIISRNARRKIERRMAKIDAKATEAA